MLELEVLVGELGAVDALAAGAVAGGEVAALDHELLDDAVELAALVVQRLAGLADPLLARAQRPEVLGRLGHHVVVQLERHPPGRLAADGDVKEDAAALLGAFVRGHGGGGGDRDQEGRMCRSRVVFVRLALVYLSK